MVGTKGCTAQERMTHLPETYRPQEMPPHPLQPHHPQTHAVPHLLPHHGDDTVTNPSAWVPGPLSIGGPDCLDMVQSFRWRVVVPLRHRERAFARRLSGFKRWGGL